MPSILPTNTKLSYARFSIPIAVLVYLIYLLYDSITMFLYTSCKYSQEDDAPIPVILMSLGRSGSSVTWSTISTLMGKQTVAYEYTGQTRAKSDKFFAELDPRIGSRFATLKLCYIQKKTIGADIIGFQWKPYQNSFTHKYAIGAFKDIGEAVDPRVRVIFLERNPLDRRASNLRHNQAHSLSAHCAIDDEECVRLHREKAREGVILPTGPDLRKWLQSDVRDEEKLMDILSLNGIPYIHVSYEKLYHSESAEEWMRIFRFLGRGPGHGLTMQTVRESFSIAATTTAKRNDTIANFKDVEESLRNTRYQHYLDN